MERKIEADVKKEVKNPHNLKTNIVVQCLGIIKCLQLEGDLDLHQNSFYVSLLQRYSKITPLVNSNKQIHNFSNFLIKVIENFKKTQK